MKPILTFFLVLVGVNCIGQNILDHNSNFGLPGAELPSVDTERVIMLVQDTTISRYPYMMKGYFAKERRNDQWNDNFFMVVTNILDNSKKPISKNIVIWESITIK